MMDIREVLNKGIAHHEAGEFDEAASLYRSILDIKPDHAAALQLLGSIYCLEKRYDEVIPCYKEYLDHCPRDSRARADLGNIYLQLGDTDRAIACYREALVTDGSNPEIINYLGVALKERNMADQAVKCFHRAIELQPDNSRSYYLLAGLYRQQKDYENAVDNYRKAIDLNSGYAEAFNDLGLTLQERGDFDGAIACFTQLINLAPHRPEALNNLGNALQYSGKLPEAIEYFEKALLLNPASAEIHFNLSQSLLLSGNFKDGWREYEWRKKLDEISLVHRYRDREWNGEDIKGKTILLYAEQGFGDAIQFMRYSELVAGLGARVILECQESLVSTALRVKGHDLVIARGDKLPGYDLHCSLLSLPYLFGTEIINIPKDIPYIHAEPGLACRWGRRIKGSENQLKVGIAWAGKTAHSRDEMRSIPLALYRPLFETRNVKFYSLQKGDAAEESKRPIFENIVADFSDQITDFSDTAALIENLDLVISVDTAVAHLAGAMGKPVWMLLPYAPDWRWMLEGDNSPWYPTMRLFRQPAHGDWESVMRRMARKLAEYR